MTRPGEPVMTKRLTPHLPRGLVPDDARGMKESPERAGALGSSEELLGRPDSIPKRETR